MDDDDDVCHVCHEERDSTCASLPCGHIFHICCILDFAQYDVRCPTCRVVPVGVKVKKEDSDAQRREAARNGIQELQRQWRNRAARRRRFLRKHPDLMEKDQRLRQTREEIFAHYERASHIYDQKTKAIWRSDPEIREQLAAATRARRRERRLEQQLREAMPVFE